jgi:hypothetical protein
MQVKVDVIQQALQLRLKAHDMEAEMLLMILK